jgi:hypothetical protein
LLHPVYFFKNNAVDPATQHLLVQHHDSFCGFLLFDPQQQQVHAWVLYELTAPLDETMLSQLTERQEWLRSSFRSVTIADYNAVNTLVPKPFFIPGSEKQLPEVVPGLHHNHILLEDATADVVNLFQVPAAAYTAFARLFPAARWKHHETAVLQQLPTEEAKINMELWFHRVFLFAEQNGKWLLLQQRAYQTPEDVLYHVLNCKKQFGMRDEVMVTVTGMIEEQSALYKLLHQYILNLEPEQQLVYGFPPNTSDIPNHTKSSLDRILTCVS